MTQVAERPVPHPALNTRLCDLFGVEYPIVQTGMGWVSDAKLTAATANAGGLGILSAGLLSFEELSKEIDAIQSLTNRPFGVNIRADQADAAKRIDLMISKGVKVASFALAPKEALIDRCKQGGLAVVCSIGAKRHAEKVAAWGVDAVIVQGGEGGGHTGQVPTSLLLPQVASAVDIAVIGAGGFFDGRGLVSALAYGADGVAMGTRFLMTAESPVADAVKNVYLSTDVNGTMLTKEIDGVPQRVIRGKTIEKLEGVTGLGRLARAGLNALAFQKMSGTPWSEMIKEGLAMKKAENLSWSRVVMAANAPMLYRTALVDGDAEAGIMASGQVVGMIDDIPTVAELINRIITEANDTLARLGA